MRRRLGAVLTVLLALLGTVALAGPAAASCAQPALRSAHAFTGVVTETRSGGRVAVVATQRGNVVEVRGGPTDGSGVTSADRTYEVGARYEFHPLNAATPYEDNGCTATRRLGVGRNAPSAGADKADAAGRAAGTDGSAGADGAAGADGTAPAAPGGMDGDRIRWVSGAGLVAAALAVLAVVTLRRKTSHPS